MSTASQILIMKAILQHGEFKPIEQELPKFHPDRHRSPLFINIDLKTIPSIDQAKPKKILNVSTLSACIQ